MSNTITPALQEINKLTDKWEASFKSIDKIAVDIATKMAKISKTDSSGLASSEVTERLVANSNAVKLLNEQLEKQKQINKQLKDSLDKLVQKRAKNNSRTTEEIENQKILARNARVSAKANSTLASSYDKASAKLIQLRNSYKNLATQQQLGIKLTDKQEKEMKQLRLEANMLDDALKKVDRAVGQNQRSVGNYGKAVGSLTKMVKASIVAFGVYSTIEIAKSIIKDVKAIDGMNKALKQVTETTEVFNQAKGFLTDLAEEAGVEIIGLTRSYTKFLASAKTTNLTLGETQNIFRQVAKAGAVLGLSTDDINGSFRALEQILSKGKVQAEEIRGQLGERLPGAFQILAKSMGLTTAELSKQLELGNVLSEEVLPKFARELEKTYSLDKIEKVETLVSAQNRLGNEWTEFVESVDSGSGVISKSLIGIFDALSFVIEGFSLMNASFDEYNQKLKEVVSNDAFKETIKGIKEEAEASGRSVSDVAKVYKKINQERLDELKAEEEGLKQNKKRLQEFQKQEGTGAGLAKFNERKFALVELDKRIRSNIATQGMYNGIVEASSSLIEQNTEATENQNEWLIKTISNRSKEYTVEQLSKKSKEELLEILSKINKKKDEENEKTEKQVSLLKEWIESIKEINRLRKERFDSGVSFGEQSLSNDPFLEGLVVPSDEETLNALNDALEKTKQRLDAIKGSQDDLLKKETLLDALGGLEQTLQIQSGTFEKLFNQIGSGFDDAGESARAFGEIAKGAFATITQASNQRAENELRNLEIEKETALQFAGDSVLAKEQIEQEYDDKQKAIRRKQAEQDRNIALFNIAVDTASGIVNAASKVATIPLIPFIAGIGLAQAAVIASAPLPEFKDGHLEGTYEGFAKINDEKSPLYREIVARKDGSIDMYKKRDQIIHMNKGDKVLPAKMTDGIIQDMKLRGVLDNLNISMSNQSNDTISEQQIERAMSRAFSKQPKNIVNIDKDGMQTYMLSSHTKNIIKNNSVRFK